MASSHYFKVFAAIDFGTDGTGLAYCIPETGKVYIHNKWKKWKNNKNDNDKNDNVYDVTGIKPKTAILLNEDGEFVAFGDNALKIYLNMNDNTTMLFEHFKMNLYTKPHYTQQLNDDEKKNDDQYKIQIKDKLRAVNGKEMASSTVFIEALKHLKKSAMHVFKRNKLQIKSNREICWIITVPAIWDDIAKGKMKQWAIAAGMIDPNLKNHLLIRYEPDCAALSIQQEIMGRAKNNIFTVDNDPKGKVEPKLLENEKYILIDAGGGTTDIACHQVLKDHTVRELLHPSGGAWGDMHCDIEFHKILAQIFNNDWIRLFKTKEPNSYLEIFDNFRKSKWTFSDSKEWHNVRLPIAFIETMEQYLQEHNNNDDDIDIEDVVEKFELNGIKNGFELSGESLRISSKIWKKEFFDKLINPTIAHCKQLLAHRNMKNCKYLCIVGGFGAIKYFQTRLRKAFGPISTYKLDIIIPERPILSVLDGAARMAMNMDYIKSRVLSRTYGVKCHSHVSSARKNGISEEYIQQNKVYNDYKKRYSVRGCYHVFANIGKSISAGKVINHTFARSYPDQRHVSIPIMTTYLKNPGTAGGCTEIAKLKVKFNANDKNDDIQVEFHFHGTMIKVYAFTMSNPNDKKEVELKYSGISYE